MTSSLAVRMKEEKTDINVPFSAEGDLAVIRGLSDEVLVAHITGEIETFLTDTDIRFRRFSLRLQPYFAEFHNRFKAEKKAGRHYLGFTDFDRACDTVLHYSGKQVRRIEAGQPTPPKQPKPTPPKLTPAELEFCKAERELQGATDAAVHAALEERNSKENLTAKEKCEFEKSLEIIRALVFAVRPEEQREAKKAAVAFLKDHKSHQAV